MKIRRKLLSFLITVGMVFSMLTGMPVHAAVVKQLVLAGFEGWNEDENKPNPYSDPTEYRSEYGLDVKDNGLIYIGIKDTSKENPFVPIEVSQMDDISITDEKGDPAAYEINPFSSGWDDQNQKDIYPDEGFFNLRFEHCGTYTIKYGELSATIYVNMPRFGIYSTNEYTEDTLVPVQDGRVRFSSVNGGVFYAHIDFGVDDNGQPIEPHGFDFSAESDSDKFTVTKEANDDQTFKITIAPGMVELGRVFMNASIEWVEGEEPEKNSADIGFEPKLNGLVICWDDNGNFRERPDDYRKIFDEIPVKTHRRVSVGIMSEDAETGDLIVVPYEGVLKCGSKAVTIEQSKENDEVLPGVYDFYISNVSDENGYIISNEEGTDSVTLNVYLTRLGIYSSKTPSVDTLLCSEWDGLTVQNGKTYYVIPKSNDYREVSHFEVHFAKELGVDDFVWDRPEKDDENPDENNNPVCTFSVSNMVDYELYDGIQAEVDFVNDDDQYDSYRFDTRFNVMGCREGMLVSNGWYEDDFRTDINDFSTQASAVTFWDTGIHLGIGTMENGENIVTPITDIAKLSITDKDGNAVPKDVAFIKNKYERRNDEQQQDVTEETKPGVYALRFDQPGEYKIQYKTDNKTESVTINVEDPMGAYYSDMPVAGDSLKNIINPIKNEAFLYTDEDRTFYFAFRPVQEKDDKGKVIRKYVYGTGTGNAEAEAFTLCRSYYDESLREDVHEPITDPNYAKIERVSDVGEYEVYKITLGKNYDNYGLMTRFIKKKLIWDQLGNGEWGYTDEYQNEGEDDFYINMQEKPSGLMTAWPDGDSFPHDMEAYEKTKHIDVGNHARIAVGLVTENENGYQMTPVNGQISLLNEDGNPVGEDSSITKTGDGIYELYIPKCGNYKLAYKAAVNGEAHIYYANIVSKLPDIAFYSDSNPSDQNMVNNGSEEYRYDNGATYYLCHNFDEWRLNNEIDSITITSPSFGEEFKRTYDAAYIKSHKVLDEIIIPDDMSEAYFEVTIKKKDQNWDDQRDFHFMKTAEGFSVGWPGDNASVSTDPKDYQGKIHVNMRCHEWRTFAVITSDDDNKKTVTPIHATQESLGDFSITDSEGQAVADEDAYISLAYPEGDARDGLFEVFFNKPGQYRIYYGDEFVVVNCAIENVAFAEKQGTFSSKNYEIMSDDPFGADVGSVDEADFYIATLDESDSGYDRYDSTIIKGIEIKNPTEQDENFKKNFTYEISEDGTSAKIHVDRNVNLDFIDFEVVYDVKSIEKDGDGYSQRGSWEGRDYFTINIPEDERTLIDISKVKWGVYDFVYDNTSKSVTLTGLSDEYKDIVDIKYTDNSKKDIGKYTAKAEIKIKDDYKTKYRLPRPIPENISSLEWQIVIPVNVKAIIDSINILPAKDKVVIADKVKIESIRKAYDALKDYEKSIIEEATLKKLSEAEKAIKTLEEKQAEADKPDKPDKPKKTEKDPAKVGATITDNKSKAQYKVTKAGTKNKTGEVSLKKPKSKTLSKFTIPKTISVDGIKYTVTAIGNGAFRGQKKLKSISIPDSVTKIGDNAFNGCISLLKITISKGVKRIGAKAFYGCKKLKTIVVKPKTMTKIGNNAFKGINPKAVIKVPKGKKAYYDKKFAKKGLAATVKIKEP